MEIKTGKSTLNKKVLVVYYSRTGNTEKVAQHIAYYFNADVEKVIDKKKRSGFWGALSAGKDAWRAKTTEIEKFKHDPSQYDLVVVATPIWAWNMTPAIRTYLIQQKDKLKTTKLAFFTTSGGTKPEKIVSKMEKVAELKSVSHFGFFEDDLKNKAELQKKSSLFLKKLEQTLK